MISSRAAVADDTGHFSIQNLQVADPQGDEVLVQIKAAGVCHTDWDSQSWGKPLVMGHEGAGIVVNIGPLVTNVQVGDKVMLNWAIPCHTCFQCQEGNQHICEVNSPVTAGNKVAGGHATLASTALNGQPIGRHMLRSQTNQTFQVVLPYRPAFARDAEDQVDRNLRQGGQ